MICFRPLILVCTLAYRIYVIARVAMYELEKAESPSLLHGAWVHPGGDWVGLGRAGGPRVVSGL